MPTSLEEIREAVRSAAEIRIVGSGSKGAFLLPPRRGSELGMCGNAGIVAHEPADQVVTVRAGTTIAELQEELAKHSLCLPLPSPDEHGVLLAGFPGTVGGLVSMNMPHGLAAQCGGVRDFTLGMTVVRGDGAVAKSGSRVVKSVAGYDVHRLFIGARGTLGVVAEVTFRTFPIRALPAVTGRKTREWTGGPLWIQRVLPRAFCQVLSAAGERLLAGDEASATIWASVDPSDELPRFAHDWVLRAGCAELNLAVGQADLVRKTKAALDPAGKFNPGAMGVV